MAVEMRERPIVSGEDARRFLEKVKKNNLALDKRMTEMAMGKRENERKDNYKNLRFDY